jgi:hypothetical protein
MTELREILEQSRPALEAGLADAERELAELDERRRELHELIARARAALGDEAAVSAPPQQPERMTLHDAMAKVLGDSGAEWMTVREVAEAINGRRLYEKRDGSPVDPSQVHARANKYRSMFEKDGRKLRLAE